LQFFKSSLCPIIWFIEKPIEAIDAGTPQSLKNNVAQLRLAHAHLREIGNKIISSAALYERV
jgi:hypothetical protein